MKVVFWDNLCCAYKLKLNEAVRLIYSLGKSFNKIKKKDKMRFFANVPKADPAETNFELFS